MSTWFVGEGDLIGIAPEVGGVCILRASLDTEERIGNAEVKHFSDSRLHAGSVEVVCAAFAFDASSGGCCSFVLVRNKIASGKFRYMLFASDEEAESGFTIILSFLLRDEGDDSMELDGFVDSRRSEERSRAALILDGPYVIVPRSKSIVVAGLSQTMSKGEWNFSWTMNEIHTAPLQSYHLAGACCLHGEISAPLAFTSGVGESGQRTSKSVFLTAPEPSHILRPELPDRILSHASCVLQIIASAREAQHTEPKTFTEKNTTFAVGTDTMELLLLNSGGDVLWARSLAFLPLSLFSVDVADGAAPFLLLCSSAPQHSVHCVRVTEPESMHLLGGDVRCVVGGRGRGSLQESVIAFKRTEDKRNEAFSPPQTLHQELASAQPLRPARRGGSG
eukprot:CAMPEP_0181313332 /NCGR_PEP_ID=MMETSP1101-20121128/14192_1 /TAXON_ID=46948 /ORGANISM="Rhodomonas abbreviata, Strain Caron Lab Isolate" /LENGTH=391 /DNA_ID=CAMNT_0023420279 /DNA_START=134 /DNA_END=1306 /DNA_ORIENTATION=+